jgi:dTDP-4-dehydrorhamnose reductase
MNEKDFDRLIDEALDIPVPEGLAGRLEKQIDRYAAAGRKRRIRRFYWTTGAAAAILAAGLFLQTEKRLRAPADTYADPVEAALAAEQTLTFLSAQLNKGLHQAAGAGEEIEKVNKTIEKYLIK